MWERVLIEYMPGGRGRGREGGAGKGERGEWERVHAWSLVKALRKRGNEVRRVSSGQFRFSLGLV